MDAWLDKSVEDKQMTTKNPDTHHEPVVTRFLPAELTDQKTLQEQIEFIAGQTTITSLLDSMPNLAVLLNWERQIVYANQAMLDCFGISADFSVLGSRLGDALSCRWAETPGSCGTTHACTVCGLARSIKAAQANCRREEGDCRLLARGVNGDEAFDFRVWSSPCQTTLGPFILVAMIDISDQKRRRSLERIFFHDVLNTAGNLQSCVSLLADEMTSADNGLWDVLSDLTSRLIDEIKAQKILLAAENGDLEINPSRFLTDELLVGLISQTRSNRLSQGITIALAGDSRNLELESDPRLLVRVLGNMVLNALEASQPGQTVTLGCRDKGDRVELWVHNQTVIPPEVQLQIFNRSFSTRGENRGLGTYSIKMLSERYLGGRASFRSDQDRGTEFKIDLPVSLERRPG